MRILYQAHLKPSTAYGWHGADAGPDHNAVHLDFTGATAAGPAGGGDRLSAAQGCL